MASKKRHIYFPTINTTQTEFITVKIINLHLIRNCFQHFSFRIRAPEWVIYVVVTRFLSFYLDVFLPFAVFVFVDSWMFKWIKKVCLFVSFSLWPMELHWNFHNFIQQKCEAGQKSVDFLFWPQTIHTYTNVGMCGLVKQNRNEKAKRRRRSKKNGKFSV